ncbi:MAG: DsbA family protein [Acidobacteria bacterium]|nr:DsbA family protein [Acidobacteriota bacterium]
MDIDITFISDPGCPWGYSASPSLAALQWRYGPRLRWRLVTIGLAEDASLYEERGYTPVMMGDRMEMFRQFGMPFTQGPRERLTGTGRACRALHAVRLVSPGDEITAFRALQFGWFTTRNLMDEDANIATALQRVPGLDVPAVMAMIDTPEVEEAYQADRAEARTAAGSPTEFQGKAANTDGAVRYTAPSLIFQAGGVTLEAGGFQPMEAYDVIVANLDPSGSRRGVPEERPEDVLAEFPLGLTTQEVAEVMRTDIEQPLDRRGAAQMLIRAVGRGAVKVEPIGDDGLWSVVR